MRLASIAGTSESKSLACMTSLSSRKRNTSSYAHQSGRYNSAADRSYGALILHLYVRYSSALYDSAAHRDPKSALHRIAVRCQRFRYLVDAWLYSPPSNQSHLHFGCSTTGDSRSASTCSMETACPVEKKISENRSGLAVSCHIGLHHHMHECLKRGLGCPAQPGTGFCRVSLQIRHFCGPHKSVVDCDVLLPV